MLKYLECNIGFLIPACTPQDQGEEPKQHEESDNKSEKVAPPRDARAATVIVKKPFFLNSVELFPLPLAALATAVVVSAGGLLGSGLEGAGEAGGGGAAGVASRRAHRADDRSRVEGVGVLLAVVRIS